MYRKFLKTYLSRSEQLEKNHINFDKDVRWCNFLCQKNLSRDQFYEETGMNYCIKCNNHLDIAKKMIAKEKITYEQFKENPMIVYKKTKVVKDEEKTCDKCNETKNIDNFEAYRATCKDCRHKQAIERNTKDLEKTIEMIEKLKINKEQLTDTLRKISVSKLHEIQKHYKITRLSSDKKDDSIAKLLTYFEKLQTPYNCLGNCGFELKETFSYCTDCKKNPTKHECIEEKNLKFKENLNEFIKTLREIKPDDFYDYNLANLRDICSYLEIKVNNGNGTTKQQMINSINKKLKERDEENSKKNNDKTKLLFEDISISMRTDGFIDATQICRVRNKSFYDWNRLDSTKELIKELETDLLFENTKNLIFKISGNPEIQNFDENQKIILIDIKAGRYGYSFIHPDLAVHLAMWVDKKLAIRVSRFIREFTLTGNSFEPKTSNELLELQQNYQKLKLDFQKLEINHQKMLERKNYHKFKQGPVFYIISDNESKTLKYKPGIETVDINIRLAQHRSTTPGIKLELLVYTKDCAFIEKGMLSRYKTKRDHLNHEWIYDVCLENIITSTKTLLTFSNIKHTLEENLLEYNLQVE